MLRCAIGAAGRCCVRCFSTAGGSPWQQLPQRVIEELNLSPALAVAHVPGQGRGLVATRAVERGTLLLRAHPFVCAPASNRANVLCYHCLSTLDGQQSALHSHGRAFCSRACHDAAWRAYFQLEAAAADSLQQLHTHCAAASERFPLMAARLALTAVQHAMLTCGSSSDASRDRHGATCSSSCGGSGPSHGPPDGVSQRDGVVHSASSSASSSSSSSSSSGGSVPNRLGMHRSTEDAAADGQAWVVPDSPTSLASINDALAFLCHANVPPPPPEPWQRVHALLWNALSAVAAARGREHPAQGRAMAAATAALDVDWFTAVLARLHLNTFRVDAPLPHASLWGSGGHAALAALLAGDGAAGSALYLVPSLFNHDCEPSVDIAFTDGAQAAFRASRDLAAGEQLTVSYIDASAPVQERRGQLEFSYGFTCTCARCLEELDESSQ